MARNRWLPRHVSEYRDRHGKLRYRYRRTGFPTHLFKAAPGTDDFAVELAACRAAEPAPVVGQPVIAGSVDDLVRRFYRSPGWLRMGDVTRATYRGIIDRYRERETRAGLRYGSLPVAKLTVAALDFQLGKMHETPAAANNLRKSLKRVLNYAIKLGWRTDNPVALTDPFKSGAGWHTWTDDEIERYRARHAFGTKARLAMELALNTSARRCNVAAIGPGDMRNGKLQVAHVKGCNPVVIRASVELLRAIDAMPVRGLNTYLVTEYGNPFSVAGFGNKFREWCDQAGLANCSIHGLRKAQSRRLAESGATALQGRAVTGHKTDRTFAYYAEKADREAMADTALANLADHDLANRR